MSASQSPNDALGLRLIVGYKFARGIVAISLALALAAEAQGDGGAFLRDLAVWLRENFAGVWSMRLADLLVRVSSPHNLEIGAAALAFDGLFALFEGWALHRRFRWAPWLVIVATASLLPFELYEIVRGVHLGRVFIFAANVAILVYLVRRRVKDGSTTGEGLRRPL